MQNGSSNKHKMSSIKSIAFDWSGLTANNVFVNYIHKLVTSLKWMGAHATWRSSEGLRSHNKRSPIQLTHDKNLFITASFTANLFNRATNVGYMHLWFPSACLSNRIWMATLLICSGDSPYPKRMCFVSMAMQS